MSVKRLITQWKCLFYGIECVFKVSHLPLDARSQLSSLSAIKCKGYAMWVRNFINEFHRRILDSRMRKNQLKFEIFNIVWVWNCRNVKIFPIKWHAHEKLYNASLKTNGRSQPKFIECVSTISLNKCYVKSK